MVGELLPIGSTPEEARLDHVGPAILGAEDVAVAALVAEIGEVGDLMLLGDRDGLACLRLPAAILRAQLEDGDVALGQDEREVRVVGADRQTLVTGEAVQQDQVAADLLG